MNADRRGGFTLMEIMVTLAVVAIAMTLVLQNREQAMMNSYQARWANLARSLARELLSELEFHELDQLNGRWDKYDLIEYEIEVDEEDLLTGEEEDDEDEYEGTSFDTRGDNAPADLVDPNAEEEEEDNYPVRRVKLTVYYPDVRNMADDDPKPLSLVIETIFRALPEDEDDIVGDPFRPSNNR